MQSLSSMSSRLQCMHVGIVSIMLGVWRAGSGKSIPQESLSSNVDVRRAATRWLAACCRPWPRSAQDALLHWPRYSASSSTISKTVFSDLLLLPYLRKCIQMQIALNPINPFNHVCECVCLCVRPHACEHTAHMYLHLHKFSLEHLSSQHKISK